MKRLLSLMLTIALSLSLPGSGFAKDKNALHFNKNGKFKIAFFTDTHLVWDKQPELQKVIDQARHVISEEKPDLVFFVGDNIFGEDAAKSLKAIQHIFDGTDIPFAFTFGNHDLEEDLTDWETAEVYASHPNSLNTITRGHLDDLALPLISSEGKKTSAVLYLIDTGDYSVAPSYQDYSWIAHSQINWYTEKSRSFTRKNNGVPVPSYAFFHIPLLEYGQAFAKDSLKGVRTEDECPSELNSGMLSAMVENGDVHGMFCGHDHDNDYIARMGDIAMAYGRYTGDNTVYNHLKHGVRIIELSEGDYGFHTWIHEHDDNIAADYTYPFPVDYRLRKATSAKNRQKGLIRTLYTNVPDIENMETKGNKGETVIVENPRRNDNFRGSNVGYIYEGKVYVPETGLWTIHITANSKGVAMVDDVEIADTFYGRGMKYINLEKGWHNFKMKVFNENGGIRGIMQWRNPYEDRMYDIPNNCFCTE